MSLEHPFLGRPARPLPLGADQGNNNNSNNNNNSTNGNNNNNGNNQGPPNCQGANTAEKDQYCKTKAGGGSRCNASGKCDDASCQNKGKDQAERDTYCSNKFGTGATCSTSNGDSICTIYSSRDLGAASR